MMRLDLCDREGEHFARATTRIVHMYNLDGNMHGPTEDIVFRRQIQQRLLPLAPVRVAARGRVVAAGVGQLHVARHAQRRRLRQDGARDAAA